MVLDIKKLFTKGSTVGRFEYLKTVYGLLLFPSLLLYLAVLTPPNNILSYPIIIIALIVLIPYSAIYWVATYKRFNNIFDNGVISTISLIVFIFSIRFRIFRLILDLLLVLVPGKKKSDNITSSKLFWIAIPLVVIMFITARYIGFNRYIASGAMDNTLIKNDRIIINVFDKDYKRGDIIAHQANKAVYVKRIIGLPGEKVEIKNLQDGSYGVYINGKMLDEPYVKNVYDYPKLSSMPNATMVVPNDSYYVVGDNRGNSLDSRYYGAVKKDIIKGKVSHIWFPLNRRQVFTTPEYSFNESANAIENNDILIKDVSSYMDYMQKTMKANWNPPEFNNSLNATVIFTIQANGVIVNPKIQSSSGNNDMDNVAIATVRKVGKLPPLPEELAKKHGKADVQFTFTYNVHKKGE